jgi:Flp pilus assembly protein TadB
MPITATVMAAMAAVGLMPCNVAKVAVKKARQVMSETKITTVPMAMFLLLKFTKPQPVCPMLTLKLGFF